MVCRHLYFLFNTTTVYSTWYNAVHCLCLLSASPVHLTIWAESGRGRWCVRVWHPGSDARWPITVVRGLLIVAPINLVMLCVWPTVRVCVYVNCLQLRLWYQFKEPYYTMNCIELLTGLLDYGLTLPLPYYHAMLAAAAANVYDAYKWWLIVTVCKDMTLPYLDTVI